MDKDVAEEQADIVATLLHHAHTPLTGSVYIRGILPAPASEPSVCVVLGPPNGSVDEPDQMVGYDIPYHVGDHYLTGPNIAGILRTVCAGIGLDPGSHVGDLMGIPLITVDDPLSVDLSPCTPEDNAYTILRTLVWPWSEEYPDPLLLGFLFCTADRLRLYLASSRVPEGVVAVDTRPSGALTALLAALPTLITETSRYAEPDPYSVRLVDLTDW
ncbi:hypothetical protein HTZ77_13090 [Nonomuraea sp. SMC257]|uniref:Uncharacterized protein n=1 Tax=Nonomuraea montanisoli TaxID=2741721 RepID=A0A7Y6M3L3_9ACTN|nr:hypothetical protein [Nonomuraea montanisoli]NUW32359.1 hypothetical protein [Nonomuraea montanisoli]